MFITTLIALVAGRISLAQVGGDDISSSACWRAAPAFAAETFPSPLDPFGSPSAAAMTAALPILDDSAREGSVGELLTGGASPTADVALSDPLATPTVIPEVAQLSPYDLGSETSHADAGEDGTFWRRGLLRRALSDQKFLVVDWWPREARDPRFSVPFLLTLVAAVSGREGQGIDQSLESSIHASAGDSTRRGARHLTNLGNAVTVGAALGSTFMIGKWTHNERLQETSTLTAEAVLDAGLWVTFLKAVSARTRPSGGGQGQFFHYQAEQGQDNGSFPSGHAMVAFAFATVVSHEYAHKKLVPWLMYGTAAAIAYSRVALDRHWPSDVVMGAILGNSIGRMVLARQHGDTGRGIPGSLQPIYDAQHHGYGLSWNYGW